MIQKILCFFGIHKYGKVNEDDMAVPPIFYKICQCCNKTKFWDYMS